MKNNISIVDVNKIDNCFISVVILTFNRVDMLDMLLKELSLQTLIQSTEVIVVDNGSTDTTNSYLLNSEIVNRFVRLSENVGCAGRNEGLKIVNTKYVVTLDDDVFLHRPDELERIISFFEKNPESDALNFKILFPSTKEIIPFNWYHPRDYEIFQNEMFLTDYISEGAVAFRSNCFSDTGYYSEEFFLGHEGPDLALRLMNNGYKIHYSGEIEVLHRCSKMQRTTWRNTYYDTRNYLWVLVRNYPFHMVPARYGFSLAKGFYFAFSRKQLKWFIRGIIDSFIGLPDQYSKREVLKRETIDKICEIRRFQQGFLGRLRDYAKKNSSIDKHIRN